MVLIKFKVLALIKLTVLVLSYPPLEIGHEMPLPLGLGSTVESSPHLPQGDPSRISPSPQNEALEIFSKDIGS